MEKENLVVHISDKTTDMDLRIYDDKGHFTFYFEFYICGVKATRTITMEEDMATLLFMGLSEIFYIKEDSRKKTQNTSTSSDILEDFFKKLKQYDEKFNK